MFSDLNRQISTVTRSLNEIPVYKLEKTLELFDRFNAYADEDKKKISMLLNMED